MPWRPPRARTAAMPSSSMNPKQSQRKLPSGVWTSSARSRMPTAESAPNPVRPGSSSRTSMRWPSPRSPVSVTQRCPLGGTYCRSSSQIAQCAGGFSLSACCTPQVRQMYASTISRYNRQTMEMVRAVEEAEQRLEGIAATTAVQASIRLSEKYGATILLKREDVQAVRSFKIRGAYNKIASLSDEDRKRPIVCASAGNHAQGVAFGCAHLGIGGALLMPRITPTQKIERVEHFGGEFVESRLVGDSYDESSTAAQEYCARKQGIFVHPFDDLQTIAGQGTVGKEIYDATDGDLGFVIVPIGGGGLASGVASYIKEKDPAVVVIGAEPAGSPSMYESLKQGRIVPLTEINTFVDGAAVRKVGQRTFDLCRRDVG